MKNFHLVRQFNGYRNKRDVTNIGATFLVDRSQNVLISDGEKVATRKGYTVDGTENTVDDYAVEGSYEWNNNLGKEIPLRSFNDEIQYRYLGEWYTLEDGFSSAAFEFATAWDFTEEEEVLLMVNGDNTLRMWSGGITTLLAVTANTIQKENGGNWTEEGFLTAGTREVVLGGIVYTYTGGENTDTLTGVTPDPTGGGHTTGDIVHQTVRTSATTPASNVSNDLIAVLDNQIWIGDKERLDIYVSKNTDYNDFTFSSPRIPGDGAVLNLDSAPKSMDIQEDVMYIGGTKNDWYASALQLSDDLLNETLSIRRLKTGPGQGPKSQGLVAKAKNNVVYISEEPTMDLLGRAENISTPQSRPLSDPIKTEFGALDFDNGHMKYFKNQMFISTPDDGRVYIYDFERAHWQPPQVFADAIGRFAIIGGELFGHSATSPNTYKLFDGTKDNGGAILARASFSYRNYGKRSWQKSFDEWFTEGYIGQNTTITHREYIDYLGFSSIVENTIEGSDDSIIFEGPQTLGIGKSSLGKVPLGSLTSDPDNLRKFRIIQGSVKIDFYEIQVEYETDDVDQEWEILAQGGNIAMSTNDNNFIKK